ncbi:O-antigen ligase family protein [Rarobacter incanus]|uniref:O-antigen ligase-like membrane protein n=1 Tax=Rarobacter incanus TaxID=153494 RepID=A0A542SRN4_9MICO|nr:O-antigen ligase family protein [Rarobacter incanus]TQK77279.1 O-antigen ligase-like membrane protein [Rarobacter incanus]
MLSVNQRRRAAAAVVCIALTTVACLPGALDPYTLPKIAVAYIGIALAASVPGWARLPRPLVLLMCAGGVWLAIAAALGAAPAQALAGAAPRFEGIITIPAYIGSLWAGARLLSAGDEPASPQAAARGKPRRSTLARPWTPWPALNASLSVLAIVLLAGALLNAAGHDPVSHAPDLQRIISLLGNATDLGVVSALIALLLGAAAAERATTTANAVRHLSLWLYAVGAAAAACSVALSGSRAAVLALVAGVIVAAAAMGLRALILHRRRAAAPDGAPARRSTAPGRTYPVWIGAITVGVVGAVFLIPATAQRFTGVKASSIRTITGRFEIWQATLQLIRDHLWTGVGPSGYEAAISPYLGVDYARDITFHTELDSPHNWILQVTAVGGLPLLAITLGGVAFLGTVAVRAIINAPPSTAWQFAARFGAATGVGAALLTHLTTPGILPLALLVLGSAIGSPPRVRGSRDASRWAAPAWLAAAGVLAALTSVAAASQYALSTASSQARSGDGAAALQTCDRAASAMRWNRDVESQCAQQFAAAVQSLSDGGRTDAVQAVAAAAITEATRAISANGADLGALEARAVAYQLTGDFESADRDLSVIVDATPYDVDVLVRRGTVRANLGDINAAKQDYEAALAIDSDNDTASNNLTVLRGL